MSDTSSLVCTQSCTRHPRSRSPLRVLQFPTVMLVFQSTLSSAGSAAGAGGAAAAFNVRAIRRGSSSSSGTHAFAVLRLRLKRVMELTVTPARFAPSANAVRLFPVSLNRVAPSASITT